MGQVLIVGGGPAGMMAAIAAAGNGQQVALYEQNDKLGKKLFITGKGRCNITNDGDRETFFSNVISNPRFLYGAYARLDSTALQNLFRAWGLPLKTERGARVFPLSDKSSDVIRTLEQELRRLGVRIFLNAKVRELALENGVCKGIYLENGTLVEGEKIIVATGGLSYPVTGSTGDGYTFAIQAGHHITSLRPALTAMETRETMTDVMGISLKNVSVSVWQKKKCLYEGFGEMLFTHFGVSGPLILSASSLAGRVLEKEPGAAGCQIITYFWRRTE